ncbi:MAG: hypothetical protein ACRD2O_13900 [Terriglobia bacterium]
MAAELQEISQASLAGEKRDAGPARPFASDAPYHLQTDQGFAPPASPD